MAALALQSMATQELPLYQIYVQHALGPCPVLPEGLVYHTLEKSVVPLQCPIHCVLIEHCSRERLRQQVERLQAVSEMTAIWPYENGKPLHRDWWRKEAGRWQREELTCVYKIFKGVERSPPERYMVFVIGKDHE